VSHPATSPHDPRARGLAATLAAYLIWGIAPLYFRALAGVPPLQILAHRVVWSVLVLALALSLVRRWAAVREAIATRRRLGALVASTALISFNWGLFIWAIDAGRLLEASLGYFVNPLVNVALGAIFLGERLTRRQLAAVGIAAAGVALLVVRLGALPWISLALALSFGFYALVRKRARIDALGGLLVETALLAPLALAFLVAEGAAGRGAFGGRPAVTLLLSAAGVVTATPLVLFAIGVGRLKLSTMGLVQYVAPTCQFLIAVAVFREPFGAAQAGAFALIWASLALYTADALRRAPAPPAPITGSARALPGGR
jgi:chloramphenicol-sensitive protein RarD